MLNLPKEAEVYLLEGENQEKRAGRMMLNGQILELGENNQLPELNSKMIEAGELTLPAVSCAFIIIKNKVKRSYDFLAFLNIFSV